MNFQSQSYHTYNTHIVYTNISQDTNSRRLECD